MGVDNTSRLVFGSIIKYDDFLKVMRNFTEKKLDTDEEIKDFYYENGEENDSYHIFSEKYNGIYLRMASPYNNCDFERCIFYIGIGKGDDELTVKQVQELIFNYESYQKFFTDNDISYQEPLFFSLPDIF